MRPRSDYARSGLGVLVAAVSGPVWNVVIVRVPGGDLTFGRAVIAVTAALLLFDRLRARKRAAPVPGGVWLFIAALGLLGLWISTSTASRGCHCGGDLLGYWEVAAVATLGALVATWEPRWRVPLILAVAAGAGLSALLALAGVGGLSPGARNPNPASSRLAGPYGNPNFLAYLLAFGVPVLVVAIRRYAGLLRGVLIASLAVVGLALLLTFSRSGLIAAGVGAAVAVLLLFHDRPRARAGVAVGLAIVAALGVVVYPLFKQSRRDASERGLRAALAAQDRSGWDAQRQGLVYAGPARMENGAGRALYARLRNPGEGMSHSVGPIAAGEVVRVRFQARAARGRQLLHVGLEDNVRGNRPVAAERALGTRWEPVRVRWRSRGRSPHARMYLWGDQPAAGFAVRRIRVERRPAGAPPVTAALATRLRGSTINRAGTIERGGEKRQIDSRRAGLELAMRAFSDHPVAGIGWGDFPAYADARKGFGALPTHNDYARVLAELGLVGALLLALLLATVAIPAWGRRHDPLGTAVAGVLATGLVGLFFVNGLSAAAVTVPLGLAAAVGCARGRAAPVAAREGLSEWGGGAARTVPVGRAARAAVAGARAAPPRPRPTRWLDAADERAAHLPARARAALEAPRRTLATARAVAPSPRALPRLRRRKGSG